MIEVVELDLTVRPTAEAVVAVQRPSYTVEAARIGYDRMPGLIEGVNEVVRLPLTLLGAIESDELVGVLGYSCSGAVVDIDRLTVHPAHFRRGVGTRLLAAVHQVERAAERFEVSTASANTPAIALYRAMGYECVRTDVSEGVALSHFVRRHPDRSQDPSQE